MAQFELILPKMGESVAEATVTNWLKNVGDVIDAEESVVEVATDKVDSEVPSPVSGTLVKILVDVNGVVEVGSPIAIIEVEGEDSGSTAAASTSEGLLFIASPHNGASSDLGHRHTSAISRDMRWYCTI